MKHMFWGRSEKSNFFLHCVGITSVWTSHSRPSLSTAFSNPIRSMSPLHMQERHQHTGDGGDRGRRLIGADLKRDLMTGINLDFRGQVGLTDVQQAAGLRKNRLIERWVIPCDQLSMQSGLGVWNERGESCRGDNVSRNQCYFWRVPLAFLRSPTTLPILTSEPWYQYNCCSMDIFFSKPWRWLWCENPKLAKHSG